MVPSIHRNIVVNAPLEQVFAALDNPDNLPLYAPNVTKVSDIHRSDHRIGDTFQATYVVMGVHFDERFTYTDYEWLRKITAQFTGA